MEAAISLETHSGPVAQAREERFKISRDISLIWIERRGIAPARDLLGRVFIALGQIGVPVLLISHASWEGNCCFVVPARDCLTALDALHTELEADFERGDVTRLSARNDVILLSAACAAVSGDTAQTYERLAGQGINILVTAHDVLTGSLSVVMASQDEAAVRAALRRNTNPVPKASGHGESNSTKVSLSSAF